MSKHPDLYNGEDNLSSLQSVDDLYYTLPVLPPDPWHIRWLRGARYGLRTCVNFLRYIPVWLGLMRPPTVHLPLITSEQHDTDGSEQG